ncbi:MAG: hypothetical protein LBG05_08555 [Treponema sp.]|jgi:hypothetical protein|nr:hypothetical protein [Treponema sp.]
MSDEKTVGTKGKVLVLLLCVSVLPMLIGSKIAERGITSFGGRWMRRRNNHG